jgi:hypothetical protein
MKTGTIILALLLVSGNSFGQIYERTGKNLGIYFAGQPISQLSEKPFKSGLNNLSGSLGIIHMLVPGIYPSIGYTFNRNENMTERDNSFISIQNGHILDASLLFDKQLLKLVKGRRVLGGCHYLSLGLIAGPEYHYMLGTRAIPNESFGEIAGQFGLSFYHFQKSMGKRPRSKTRQYDVFYRRGFTPIFSTTQNGIQTNLYRQEIGIRVRLIRHQVSNFLN